jgi:DNA-directed RNA polymerase specialized sigma24 family protein
MIEDALDNIENFGDERGKLIFDLIALYNYTYEEAAEHLGLTKRQVRYQYGLITNKLMDHFRTRGIHGLEDLL